jgi:hypothetical protein
VPILGRYKRDEPIRRALPIVKVIDAVLSTKQKRKLVFLKKTERSKLPNPPLLSLYTSFKCVVTPFVLGLKVKNFRLPPEKQKFTSVKPYCKLAPGIGNLPTVQSLLFSNN